MFLVKKNVVYVVNSYLDNIFYTRRKLNEIF